MIKAIVFDLDDTLYPEVEYVKSGFIKVANLINKKFSINIKSDDLYKIFLSGESNVYNKILELNNVNYSDLDIQEMIETFRNNKPTKNELKLFDGARETLISLSKKYKLGIITDGRVYQQENKIESLDIKQFFSSIVCSDKFGIEHRKPDTLPFITISKELNVLPENMMYVGDNRNKDFAIKKDLPIVTVEVLTKNKVHNKKEYLLNIEPDYVIEDVTKLEDLLENING